MNINFRTLQLEDLNDLLEYENKKLADSPLSPEEKTLSSWSARWRQESLQHYLRLGWSFVAKVKTEDPINDEGTLAGYFIAQPLLFLDGQTQSLWIEHISFSNLKVRDELCELVYRLCREKHLQKVYFPHQNAILNSIKHMKPESWNPEMLVVKTTRG